MLRPDLFNSWRSFHSSNGWYGWGIEARVSVHSMSLWVCLSASGPTLSDRSSPQITEDSIGLSYSLDIRDLKGLTSQSADGGVVSFSGGLAVGAADFLVRWEKFDCCNKMCLNIYNGGIKYACCWFKKVFDEALSSPTEARMSLVEKLTYQSQPSYTARNRPTVGRRSRKTHAQIDKGEIKLVPGKSFFLISAKSTYDEILLPSRCRSWIHRAVEWLWAIPAKAWYWICEAVYATIIYYSVSWCLVSIIQELPPLFNQSFPYGCDLSDQVSFSSNMHGSLVGLVYGKKDLEQRHAANRR